MVAARRMTAARAALRPHPRPNPGSAVRSRGPRAAPIGGAR